MVGKFTNLTKDIKLEILESLQIPSRINKRKITPKHIIGKLPKMKGKKILFGNN